MDTIFSFFLNLFHYLSEFNAASIIFRVATALLLGSIIGSERGRHGRSAGVRTHTLVCLGSALTVIVGLYSVVRLGSSGDPMRISAQVISGIGFLCAGTIMTRNHSQVIGLTTAAGLWTTAAIGLAIGAGFYLGAFVGFAALEFTITLLNSRTRQLQRSQPDTYYLELSDPKYVNEFSDRFDTPGATIQVITAKSGLAKNVGILYLLNLPIESGDLLREFRSLEYVIIAVPQNT